MSQKLKVLKHLQTQKSITPMEALVTYGVFRLAARIHELKGEGHEIDTIVRHDAIGKPYASYALTSEALNDK